MKLFTFLIRFVLYAIVLVISLHSTSWLLYMSIWRSIMLPPSLHSIVQVSQAICILCHSSGDVASRASGVICTSHHNRGDATTCHCISSVCYLNTDMLLVMYATVRVISLHDTSRGTYVICTSLHDADNISLWHFPSAVCYLCFTLQLWVILPRGTRRVMFVVCTSHHNVTYISTSQRVTSWTPHYLWSSGLQLLLSLSMSPGKCRTSFVQRLSLVPQT